MKDKTSIDKTVLKKVLLKKVFKSEHLPFVTNRQIHHWKEIKIVDDHREYAASGMKSKYNVLDLIWINIISEMRSFRISNSIIKEVKSFLYLDTEEGLEPKVTLFEKIIVETIFNKKTLFLVLLKDMSVKLLNKEEYILTLTIGSLHHHFSLDVTDLIWEILAIVDFDNDIKSIMQHYKNTDNE